MNAERASPGFARTTLVFNVVLFQLGWFACVLGAAHDLPWIGVPAAVAIIAWHLARAAQPKPEFALIAAAALLGALFETLLVQSGWVRFARGTLIEGTAPYWMITLWAIFATTLNVSLRSQRCSAQLEVLSRITPALSSGRWNWPPQARR